MAAGTLAERGRAFPPSALKEAGIAAGIALLLALPLVGAETVSEGSAFIVKPRVAELAVGVALVFVGRLAIASLRGRTPYSGHRRGARRCRARLAVRAAKRVSRRGRDCRRVGGGRHRRHRHSAVAARRNSDRCPIRLRPGLPARAGLARSRPGRNRDPAAVPAFRRPPADGYRHPGPDLCDAGMGAQHRGRAGGSARPSAMSRSTRWGPTATRSSPATSASISGACLPLRRGVRGLLRHHPRLSGAPAARRLSRDRHPRLRRDDPHHPAQLVQFHRRSGRDFRGAPGPPSSAFPSPAPRPRASSPSTRSSGSTTPRSTGPICSTS